MGSPKVLCAASGGRLEGIDARLNELLSDLQVGVQVLDAFAVDVLGEDLAKHGVFVDFVFDKRI